jgi:hypothetical protein
LRLDGCLGLEVKREGSQLHGPLGDAPGSVPIVEDICQWEVVDHQDIECLEIVAKLPGSNEYTVKNFLNRWVANLRFREDFTDEVDWSLHPEGMAFFVSFYHDCRTNDVSSRGDVEEQVLTWLGGRQDGWRLQMVLEILQHQVCLIGPLELVVELEQFEEG